MSALRSKRRYLKWERYYARAARLNAAITMHRHNISYAHAVAMARWAGQGRWAPNGIRDVRLTGWSK